MRQMNYPGMISLLTLTFSITLSTSTFSNISLWHDGVLSPETKHQLDNFLTNLNNNYKTSYKLNIISLNFSATALHHFFHSIQNHNRDNMAYVITTMSVKHTWIWSKLLSNKNTIFLDVHNPGKDEEKDDQLFLINLLKLVPPESEKRVLLEKMTKHMMCKKTTTLVCPTSWNDDKILRNQFQEAEEDMIYCIVLECSKYLDLIFSLAKNYDLLGVRYRWFSLHHFKLENFRNLPRNLITIVLSKIGNPETKNPLNIDFVIDALNFIAEVNKTSNSHFGKYPTKSDFLQTKFKGETGFVYFKSDNFPVRHGTNYYLYQLISVLDTTGWLRIGMWENDSFDTSLMTWILNEVSKVTPPLLRIATKKNQPWMFFAAEQGVDDNTLECIVGLKCINYTSYISESNNTFEEHCCGGMLVELLQEIMKRVDFTPKLHFVKDGKFGGVDAVTNQWNGMVGEVLHGEADTALYTLTITERRAKVVAFSYPIIEAGSGILISVDKKASFPLINYGFLRPFKKDLYVATITVLAATIITLWVAERLNQQRVYNTFLGNRRKLGLYTFVENMTYGWGVFVQKVVQEGGPRTLGGRVVVGTFGFYIIIVLSSYTANLAAIKVVEDHKTEIAGIYDDKFVNPTSDFKFTSSKFTATSEFFRLSPDKRLNNMYKVMKDRLVRTRAQALKMLKSGEIQAFFEDTPSLQYMASQQEECDLKVVGKSFANSGYGMPFRFNSTWKKPISNALREMHEHGLVTALSKKWLEGTCVSKQNTLRAFSLSIEDESGILFFLGLFCIGSFFLLALEFLFKKFFSKFCYTHARSFSYNFTNGTRNSTLR